MTQLRLRTYGRDAANRRFGPGTWRWFRLGWALGQHSAEIVLAGIDSATGKKCAGGLGGEILSCGQLRFRDPSGIAAASPYVSAVAAYRTGAANES